MIRIDSKSLRAQEISKALKDFTLIVDFELPYEKELVHLNLAEKDLLHS